MHCDPRRNEHETIVEKVVKRERGGRIDQVVENVGKIIFKKCPKRYLLYDIM